MAKLIILIGTSVIVSLIGSASLLWFWPGQRSDEFRPGMADTMIMLVQPRHIRLFQAVNRDSWDLAAFEARNLRGALDRISNAIPSYKGYDVTDAVRLIFEPQMQAVDSAVRAHDPEKFFIAYRDMTASCNDCHTLLDTPQVVIEVPSSTDPSWSGQNFGRR